MQEEKKRVQMDFSVAFIAKIAQAKKRLGLVTNKEFFTRAAKLMLIVAERIEHGDELAFISKDGKVEKVHLIF